MSIGKKLVELRKKNNLSQEEVAEKIGVTRQTISKWELDETSPDLKSTKELAVLYHISIDELVGNEAPRIKRVEKETDDKFLKKEKYYKKVGFSFIGSYFVVGFCIFIIVFMIFISAIDHASSPYDNGFDLTKVTEENLTCTIDEKKYNVYIKNDGTFTCDACDETMKEDLMKLFNKNKIFESHVEMASYFMDKKGTCEGIERAD